MDCLDVGTCPMGEEATLTAFTNSNKHTRWIGCSAYKICRRTCPKTWPLPRVSKGELVVTAEVCAMCGIPLVKIRPRGKQYHKKAYKWCGGCATIK